MLEAKTKRLGSGEIENEITIEGTGEDILFESISLIVAVLESIEKESKPLYNDVLQAVLRIIADKVQGNVYLKKERFN